MDCAQWMRIRKSKYIYVKISKKIKITQTYFFALKKSLPYIRKNTVALCRGRDLAMLKAASRVVTL
jgi:hypothetical protein